MTANPADFLKLNHCLMAVDWHAANTLEIPDLHGEPEKTAKIKNEHSRKLWGNAAFFWSSLWPQKPPSKMDHALLLDVIAESIPLSFPLRPKP